MKCKCGDGTDKTQDKTLVDLYGSAFGRGGSSKMISALGHP